MPPRHGPSPVEAGVDLRRLLRIADEATYDVRSLWAPRSRAESLTVLVGIGTDGQPVYLDLTETPLGGAGPHGLCSGATGSGKTELLRSLVLTLAMTHPPDRLNLLLVDNTGSTTFGVLDGLPHLAGRVASLAENPDQIDRLRAVLQAEMRRRQRVLRDAGPLAGIAEYDRRRDSGQPLPPLPRLLVVVDEFDELTTAWPELLDLATEVGRAGGPLGVHLLLATQRVEEGRLRGLEQFLSYRLGLRTFTAYESRALLGVPDASTLPPLPGSGYLKVGATRLERFRAAQVSGPYLEAGTAAGPGTATGDTGRAAWDLDDPPPSTLDVVARRLGEHARPAPRIWLPPLPAALPLDAVTGPAVTVAGLGLTVVPSGHDGHLRIPVGLLDRPAELRQEPFMLDLSGGHLCALGAPRTGKSTLLCTLVAAAALTHTPRHVRFYCVGAGDGTLAPLAGLPHVAGVAGRDEADRVRRIVGTVGALLAERTRVLSERSIDSVETMRRMHSAGELPGFAAADIVLVIDDHAAFATEFGDLLDIVRNVAVHGRNRGVHLVLTAGRPTDVDAELQTAIGHPIELALGSPRESTIGVRASARLPMDTPGRCLTAGALHAQIALPRIDGGGTHRAIEALEELVARVSAAWPGERLPPA
ncbi:MAG TPA: FtsK/SpoIIIE domain-containing protein [Rugosimonospora sp.]|jgi:S-DNA-T family DNA segregation ATPase FtsK/SpoIIIE